MIKKLLIPLMVLIASAGFAESVSPQSLARLLASELDGVFIENGESPAVLMSFSTPETAMFDLSRTFREYSNVEWLGAWEANVTQGDVFYHRYFITEGQVFAVALTSHGTLKVLFIIQEMEQ